MPRHKFTDAETVKGFTESVKTRKAQLKVTKMMLRLQESGQLASIIEAGLRSPVIAGTLAYFVVHAAEVIEGQLTSTTKVNPASQSNVLQTALDTATAQGKLFLNSVLGPLGPLVGSTISGGGIFAGVDYAALKLAILVYIASGGNLAGILSSIPGVAAAAKA